MAIIACLSKNTSISEVLREVQVKEKMLAKPWGVRPGVGTSLRAVGVLTPESHLICFFAFLRSVFSTRSLRRLVRERCTVRQHAMHDDGEFAGQRHRGLFPPGPLGEPHRPALQGGAALERFANVVWAAS